MQISNDWKIEDKISGLRLAVVPGMTLDRLHIESIDGNMDRDFWFTKKGEFDGTGSDITEAPNSRKG